MEYFHCFLPGKQDQVCHTKWGKLSQWNLPLKSLLQVFQLNLKRKITVEQLMKQQHKIRMYAFMYVFIYFLCIFIYF